MELRLETIKALQNALNCTAKAEHESHLPQSYGAILSVIEELTKTLLKTP